MLITSYFFVLLAIINAPYTESNNELVSCTSHVCVEIFLKIELLVWTHCAAMLSRLVLPFHIADMLRVLLVYI